MAAKPMVHSIDELEEFAASYLPKMVRDYFNGGALDGITLRANKREYEKWYMKPRVLCNVSNVDTTAQAIPGGHEIPFPCCVAPAAMQRMAHPQGEEAMGRACGKFGTVMGLSTFATTSLEDVKKAANQARKDAGLRDASETVLQMYLFENRDTSVDLIRRAESRFILSYQTCSLGNFTKRGWISGHCVDGRYSVLWKKVNRDPKRLRSPVASSHGKL